MLKTVILKTGPRTDETYEIFNIDNKELTKKLKKKGKNQYFRLNMTEDKRIDHIKGVTAYINYVYRSPRGLFIRENKCDLEENELWTSFLMAIGFDLNVFDQIHGDIILLGYDYEKSIHTNIPENIMELIKEVMDKDTIFDGEDSNQRDDFIMELEKRYKRSEPPPPCNECKILKRKLDDITSELNEMKSKQQKK